MTLLTTHDMMEANELGDRIGVMSKGRLKCIGSPQFLKHRFGVGYDMTIAPQGAHDGGGSACDVEAVQSLISRFVPTSGRCSSSRLQVTPRRAAGRRRRSSINTEDLHVLRYFRKTASPVLRGSK